MFAEARVPNPRACVLNLCAHMHTSSRDNRTASDKKALAFKLVSLLADLRSSGIAFRLAKRVMPMLFVNLPVQKITTPPITKGYGTFRLRSIFTKCN